MAALEGQTAQVWDARAELDIGLMLRRYVAERPAPEDSRLVDDIEEWASNLAQNGRHHLGELGQAPLAVVRSAGDGGAVVADAELPESRHSADVAERARLTRDGRMWRYLTSANDWLEEDERLMPVEELRRTARAVVAAWLEASEQAQDAPQANASLNAPADGGDSRQDG
jgi:hypothetical protein